MIKLRLSKKDVALRALLYIFNNRRRNTRFVELSNNKLYHFITRDYPELFHSYRDKRSAQSGFAGNLSLLLKHSGPVPGIRGQRRNEFYKLIKWCDVLVHFGSNTALEAMIIDRPIVTIDLFDEGYTVGSWIKGGNAVIEVKYNEDVKEAVEKALKDEKILKVRRKKIVKKYCGKVDGKASEKVVKLIYSLVK